MNKKLQLLMTSGFISYLWRHLPRIHAEMNAKVEEYHRVDATAKQLDKWDTYTQGKYNKSMVELDYRNVLEKNHMVEPMPFTEEDWNNRVRITKKIDFDSNRGLLPQTYKY
jgi:hypothetical protein